MNNQLNNNHWRQVSVLHSIGFRYVSSKFDGVMIWFRKDNYTEALDEVKKHV